MKNITDTIQGGGGGGRKTYSFLLASIIALCAAGTNAVTYTWTGGGASASISDAGNWGGVAGDAIAFTASNILCFNQSATADVSVPSDITVSAIVFGPIQAATDTQSNVGACTFSGEGVITLKAVTNCTASAMTFNNRVTFDGEYDAYYLYTVDYNGGVTATTIPYKVTNVSFAARYSRLLRGYFTFTEDFINSNNATSSKDNSALGSISVQTGTVTGKGLGGTRSEFRDIMWIDPGTTANYQWVENGWDRGDIIVNGTLNVEGVMTNRCSDSGSVNYTGGNAAGVIGQGTLNAGGVTKTRTGGNSHNITNNIIGAYGMTLAEGNYFIFANNTRITAKDDMGFNRGEGACPWVVKVESSKTLTIDNAGHSVSNINLICGAGSTLALVGDGCFRFGEVASSYTNALPSVAVKNSMTLSFDLSAANGVFLPTGAFAIEGGAKVAIKPIGTATRRDYILVGGCAATDLSSFELDAEWSAANPGWTLAKSQGSELVLVNASVYPRVLGLAASGTVVWTDANVWTNSAGEYVTFAPGDKVVIPAATPDATILRVTNSVYVGGVENHSSNTLNMNGLGTMSGNGTIAHAGSGTLVWNLCGGVSDGMAIDITNGIFKRGEQLLGHMLACSSNAAPIAVSQTGSIDFNSLGDGANDYVRAMRAMPFHDRLVMAEGAGFNGQGAIKNTGWVNAKSNWFVGPGQVELTGDTLIYLGQRIDLNGSAQYNRTFYRGNTGEVGSPDRPYIIGEDYVLTFTSPNDPNASAPSVFELNNSDIAVRQLCLTNNAVFEMVGNATLSAPGGIVLSDKAQIRAYGMQNSTELLKDPITVCGTDNRLLVASGSGYARSTVLVEEGATFTIGDNGGDAFHLYGIITNRGTLKFTGKTQYVYAGIDGNFSVAGSALVIKSGATVNGNITLTSGSLTVESGATVTGNIAKTGGTLTVNGTVNGTVSYSGGTFDASNGSIAAIEVSGINTVISNLKLLSGQTLTFDSDARLSGNVVIDGGTIRLAKNNSGIFSDCETLKITENGMTVDTAGYFGALGMRRNAHVKGTITKKGAGTISVERGIVNPTDLAVEEGDVRVVASGLVHRFRFDGDLKDDVTGMTPRRVRGCTFNADGKTMDISGGSSPYDNHCIEFDSNFIPRGDQTTVEFWFTCVENPPANSKLFAFGHVAQDVNGLWGMTLHKGNDTMGRGLVSRRYYDGKKWRSAYDYDTWSGATGDSNDYGRFVAGHRYHVAATVSTDENGAMRTIWYRHDLTDEGGTYAYGTNVAVVSDWHIKSAPQYQAYISHNPWSDAASHLRFEDMRVWNVALSAKEIEESIAAGPDAALSTTIDALAHRYRFDGNLQDDITGKSASLSKAEAGVFTNTTDGANNAIHLYGGAAGFNGYIDFGANLLPTATEECTIELWFTDEALRRQAKLLYIGPNDSQFLIFSLHDITGSGRNVIVTWEASCNINKSGDVHFTSALNASDKYHLSIVITTPDGGDSVATYTVRNAATGEIVGTRTFSRAGWKLATMNQSRCWVGDGHWHDACATTTLEEMRIWRKALTQEELAKSVELGPDVLPSAFLNRSALAVRKGENASGPAVTVAGVESFYNSTIDFGTVPGMIADFGDVISFTNCSSTAFAGLASMTADFETRPRGTVKVGPRLGLGESDAASVITPMLEGEPIKALRPRAEGEDYYLVSYGLQLSIR